MVEWLKEHQFKKGKSGNPGGRFKIPTELSQIRKLSQAECAYLVSKYARMTRGELQSAIEDIRTPMVDLTIASIFAQSAKNGDYQRLGFLLDRTCGKVPTAELFDEDNEGRKELRKLTDQEIVQLVKDKLPELEAG